MIGHKLTGNRCRCAKCGTLFNSVSVFDRHRVGSWQDAGKYRRCLSVDEMVARGWSQNARGFWIERQRIDHLRTDNERSSDLLRRRA